ncbi:MAG TPA: hypothetical protein VJ927_05110 [Actinomycetota bacterium]|nr:hypothetical protein [Actinomycetota bacterium]
MGKSRAILTVALAAALLVGGSFAPVDRGRTETKDPATYAERALEALQTARDTSEPSWLIEAEELLERSFQLQPKKNFDAELGMAVLANARHDFGRSVRWARTAIETDRYDASPYGVLGDALFELGRYRAAEKAYQSMADLRPDYASFIRASYAHQFRGDTRGAIRAMKLALRSAGPFGEPAAGIRHQLGDIYFGLGDLREAARQNRIAAEVAPGFVPPQVGLAEVAIARGRLEKATVLVESAATALPSLEYLIKLGDLFAATERIAEAADQYRVVARKLASYRSSGVLPDVDFILFYADHSLRPTETLREARSIYADRPTGAAADALGWVLYRQDRPAAAWDYAREALGSPQVDASVEFHAGMIARALGKDAAARLHLERALEMRSSLPLLELLEAKKAL